MLGLLSILSLSLSLSLSLIWCGQWVLCHEKGTPRAININTLSNTPVYILFVFVFVITVWWLCLFTANFSFQNISVWFLILQFQFFLFDFCFYYICSTSRLFPSGKTSHQRRAHKTIKIIEANKMSTQQLRHGFWLWMCVVFEPSDWKHNLLFVSSPAQCRPLLLSFWRIFQLRHFVGLRFDIWILDWKRLLSQMSTIWSHNLSVWSSDTCFALCRLSPQWIQGWCLLLKCERDPWSWPDFTLFNSGFARGRCYLPPYLRTSITHGGEKSSKPMWLSTRPACWWVPI